MSQRHRFRGQLYRVGMNYCVDVPAAVGRRIGGDPPPRYVAIAGTSGGVSFRTRLTPRGGGAYRLFLTGSVRAAAEVDIGEHVEVTLWRDDSPRATAVPDDLASALAALDGGRQTFEALTEAQRSGMLEFLERARTPETRERYVDRIVANVLGRMS